jgi:hypothetical protein
MRFVMYGALFVVALYALIDCLSTPGARVRTLPKAVWLIVIILIPGFGALAWLLLGRASIADGGRLGSGRSLAAPDDDPDFLRQLGDQTWSQRMKRKRDRTEPPKDDRGTGPEPAAG